MKQLVILSIVWAAWSAPAVAQTYAGCDKAQDLTINQSIRQAKDLTLRASVTVGDTAEYNRWFGAYAKANAETVRSNLKAVVSAIRSGAVTAECHAIGDSCDIGEYAWVYAHEPFILHFCPAFFTLPQLVALEPGTRRSDNGTREGTIVHEISHFLRVAGTDDHCYSRTDCADMAARDARRAVDNADSYQYFTEDVTYYAHQPLAGK